jgi:hypothetical protein
VAYRANIVVEPFSSVDSHGRQSILVDWTNPRGERRGQAFFACPAVVVARLRYNIARQFWFDRARAKSGKD